MRSGSYSYQIVEGYCQAIARECLRTGRHRVLIEEDIERGVSFAEAYRISTEVPQRYLADLQIAFVDVIAEQDELNKFGEIVAVNSGVNGKMFDSVADAEDWLLRP